MAGKITGLGSAFYVGGYDISGDVNALSSISSPMATLDVTGINKYAHERLGGLRDGSMAFTTIFNVDAGQEHLVLSNFPRTDTIGSFFAGQAIGNAAASINAKQVDYAPTRANDGMLTNATSLQANGYGLEWGRQLTAGARTDTAATNGSGYATLQTGDPYVFLPGSSGNTVTTPDAASLDIVGDIDIRARIAMTDWTPAADTSVVSKYTVTGNQRSYSIQVLTTGALNLQWSADGTVQVSKSSTVSTGFTDGTIHWIRATLDVDNGAAGNDVKFYTSADGVTWTQLGATVTTASTTSIFASTAVMELGSRTNGTAGLMTGKIFEAQVLNGIGGTSVAHPVATGSAVTDATPLTWTINGTAFATTQTEYGLQAYLQVFSFAGTDVTVKLQESADNGSTDSWTDVVGGGFTQVTSTTPQAQRLAASSTLTVEKYLRAVTVTTGGFTSLVFAVAVTRNETTVSF